MVSERSSANIVKKEKAGRHEAASSHSPPGAANISPADSEDPDAVKVYPRRKLNALGTLQSTGPVRVSKEALEELFDLPLRTAAERLGICITAIKRICRKFGIVKWPYRVPCKHLQEKSECQPSLATSRATEGDKHQAASAAKSCASMPRILPPASALARDSSAGWEGALAGLDGPVSMRQGTTTRSASSRNANNGPAAANTEAPNSTQAYTTAPVAEGATTTTGLTRAPSMHNMWSSSNDTWLASKPILPSFACDSPAAESRPSNASTVLPPAHTASASFDQQQYTSAMAENGTACGGVSQPYTWHRSLLPATEGYGSHNTHSFDLESPSAHACHNLVQNCYGNANSIHAEWLVAPVDMHDIVMAPQTIFCNEDWNMAPFGFSCFGADLGMGCFSKGVCEAVTDMDLQSMLVDTSG